MKVSIIIRTKNEERWINAALMSVFNQDFKDFEVVLVDNESTDKTIEKASRFPIAKTVTCKDYRPGLALNLGIRASTGEFIVCLSGHCVPVDSKWLSSLLRNFSDESVAAVYGRQEPLASTPDTDKRDLSIIFGLDRRVQRKDGFFHNANSMLRRRLWEEVPFDETVTNIEDRVWAEKMIHKGLAIVYEPEASVFHYHGIHQNVDRERCANVVRILEDLKPDLKGAAHVDVRKLNVVALLPVKGEVKRLKGRPLLEYTVRQALAAEFIGKVIVSTDNPAIAELAKSLGAEAPFLREASLSEDFVDIEKVMQYSLQKIEEQGIFPDIVVYLEETFPFRPKGLLDAMIHQLVLSGSDTVIAAKKEFRSIWKTAAGAIERIDTGHIPRKHKEPCFIGIKGLGCVTHPEFIREGSLFGEKIGIHDLVNPYSQIEVREEIDFALAANLIDDFMAANR